MKPRENGLSHPLPSGMRDLLPPETQARRAIARAFLGQAELMGYEAVIPPAFEYAETIERGLGTLDPREIVRFVEPETGEVVALRPDVTPQIARMIATRLEGRPPPYRLAYDASVLRRRAGSRARTHRQISQVGVELVGVPGPDGDLELLTLSATALEAMGLSSFTIDLGHADIARSLLASAKSSNDLADALAKKDVARLAELAAREDFAPTLREAIVALPTLHGPVSLLDRLPRSILEGPCRAAVDALRDLVARLEIALKGANVRAAKLRVDLGEVRGLAYYTGPFFQLFADGPGAPIGGGGRYDQLLARFGRDLPATGLALDVDALIWALKMVESPMLQRPRRIVVTGEGAEALASRLRTGGVVAAVVSQDAEGYARAWGYSVVARVKNEMDVTITALDEASGVASTREEAPLSVEDAAERLSLIPSARSISPSSSANTSEGE